MVTLRTSMVLLIICALLLPPDSYSRRNNSQNYNHSQKQKHHNKAVGSPLPKQISSGEKVIIIDPNIHAFGAYNEEGNLVRSGIVTAGNYYCRDIKRGCKTKAGTFRIHSLGGPGCKSHKYPLPKGGAPMPYCMFFNGAQGLHGSYEVVKGNVSHGCVRLHVSDAKWLRYNFAHEGTKVIVKSY
jgi:lipoprotein-anchoring transpeptidase ErfK/SrfK